MSEMVPITHYADVNPPLGRILPSPDSTVAFIPMGDVSDSGEWHTKQTRKRLEIGPGYTAFGEGDVLFAKITPCMENGKGTQAVGLPNGVGFGSTEFHVLRAKGMNSPRFVFHWTQSRDLRLSAEARMTGSAGQRRVPTDFFARFLVAQISPTEQRAIAAILDAMDEGIRRAEALVAKLEKVKAGLLHDLLTRGLDEHGQLRDPLRHPGQFKDSELGRIPREWEVKPFRDGVSDWAVGPRFPGEAYAERGNIATLRTTDMDGEGNICYRTMPEARVDAVRFGGHFLQKGDLVISRSGSIGITGVFRHHRLPVLPGAFLLRFRTNQQLMPEFARAYFNSHPGRNQVLLRAEGGVQKNVRGTSILPIPIPIPPTTEQVRIMERLDGAKSLIDQNQAHLAKLRLQKHGLMQDLLTGRVRVPEGVVGRYEGLSAKETAG